MSYLGSIKASISRPRASGISSFFIFLGLIFDISENLMLMDQATTHMSITIDQFYLSVARLTTHYYDNDEQLDSSPAKTGTGFFFMNDKDQLFLVTNRHVIIKESETHFPNGIRMLMHTNTNDFTQNRYFEVHLYKGATRLWREPKPPEADVVAIPLVERNYIDPQQFNMIAFSPYNLLPKRIRLQIGEDVLVMGYPLGEYYDSKYNLPVIRNGIVASAYPVPFRGNPYFLVDARLHIGTSGSPVTTKFRTTWLTTDGTIEDSGFAFYLLGINAATFPLPKEEEPSDLMPFILLQSLIK
jgi:hypothetical protein